MYNFNWISNFEFQTLKCKCNDIFSSWKTRKQSLISENVILIHFWHREHIFVCSYKRQGAQIKFIKFSEFWIRILSHSAWSSSDSLYTSSLHCLEKNPSSLTLGHRNIPPLSLMLISRNRHMIRYYCTVYDISSTLDNNYVEIKCIKIDEKNWKKMCFGNKGNIFILSFTDFMDYVIRQYIGLYREIVLQIGLKVSHFSDLSTTW